MSTFAEIVEDTLAEVSSYVKNQEAITVLTQTATDSDTTLTVDDANSLSRGIVEIGNELVYVKSVNATAGTVTILPGGRGWRGTTAAAHGLNTILRNNPTFPRDQIRRAINDTIQESTCVRFLLTSLSSMELRTLTQCPQISRMSRASPGTHLIQLRFGLLSRGIELIATSE